LRLELVAGLGIALALPSLAMAAENARGLATETTLTVEAHEQDGRTLANVTVVGEDGLAATGAVVIHDGGMQLAGAALDLKGQATFELALPAGDHSLWAVYGGDATHNRSISEAATAQAQATTTPNFGIAVAPATLTLTPGQSGSLIASVTPQNSSALTAPMFVTLSCSGLPDQAACTFTPENVEILPNATAAITSSMIITTQSNTVGTASNRHGDPVAWALLLPGALGLGGLAWGLRRRQWLNRLSLLALLGLVTMLGATACNARYDYYNHGPPIPPPTPAGTYTVTVTAQSSNGVTAITNSTTLALTVQ
jgi:hypothetical protein